MLVMGLLAAAVTIGILLALLLAPWYGADSRDGRDWQPTGERRRPGQ